MAHAYRPTNKKLLTPLQNISSTIPDAQVPGEFSNRALELRRDNDTVKTPEVRIADLERAIKNFLQNDLPPEIEEDGRLISVPVLYANPERWVSIQRDGFLRDHKGQIYTPLIAFKTNSITPRTDLAKNDVLKGFEEGITFEAKYTQKNRYDSFNVLNNVKPVKDLYTVSIPEWVELNFEIYIWCDFRSQLDIFLERLKFWSGKAIGDTFKFPMMIDSFNINMENTTGSDRFIRAVLPCRLKSYILLRDIGKKIIEKKSQTRSRIVLITETTTTNIED